MAEEAEVGQNVFCRCLGYPAWPAKLIDPQEAPENVRKSKHDDSRKLALFYAKRGTLKEKLQYWWAKPTEILPLTDANVAAFHPDALPKKFVKHKAEISDAFDSLMADERGEGKFYDDSKQDGEEEAPSRKRKRKEPDEKTKKKIARKSGEEVEGTTRSKKKAPRNDEAAETKLTREERQAVKIIEIMENVHNSVYPQDGEEEDLEGASDLIDKLAATRMTMSLLEETKVGLLINKMRHHPDKVFAEKCYNLRKRWSKMVKQRLTALENQKKKELEADDDAEPAESVK